MLPISQSETSIVYSIPISINKKKSDIKRLIQDGYEVINIDLNYFGNYFIKHKSVKNFKNFTTSLSSVFLQNCQ